MRAYQSVQQLLMEFAPLAGVAEGRGEQLRTAQREINPLAAKGSNPVKKAAKATAKARQTGNPSDISGAAGHTRLARMYAKQHGYPNLEKQLVKHREMLDRFKAVSMKRTKAQTKAARQERMRDLKAKLFRLKLRRARERREK